MSTTDQQPMTYTRDQIVSGDANYQDIVNEIRKRGAGEIQNPVSETTVYIERGVEFRYKVQRVTASGHALDSYRTDTADLMYLVKTAICNQGHVRVGSADQIIPDEPLEGSIDVSDY